MVQLEFNRLLLCFLLIQVLNSCSSFKGPRMSSPVEEPARIGAAEVDAAGLVGRVEKLFAEGRSEEALEIIRKIERDQPDSALRYRLMLLQAKEAIHRGDSHRANYYLRKIIEESGLAALRRESFFLLGDLLYLQRNYSAAYEAYLEVINHGSTGNDRHLQSRIWFRLAEIAFYVREDRELARNQLRNIHLPDLSEAERLSLNRLKRRLAWNYFPPGSFGLNDGNISALAIDEDDLWIGTWNGGIARYSLGQGVPTVFREGKQSLIPNMVRCIETASRRVWIGTCQGLYVYTKATSTYRKVELFEPLNAARIEALIAAGDSLFVATLGKGLWQRRGSDWERIGMHGLPGDFINCLETLGDRLFIGTMSLGIVIMDLPTGELKSFDRTGGMLTARNITTFVRDGNSLWIGTYGEGLYHWQPDSNRLDHYSKEGGTISDDWILCGVKTSSGLYFGTLGGGVNIYRPGSGEWRVIGIREGLPLPDVSVIGYFRPNIYFGTLGAGISSFDESLASDTR